MSNLIRYISGDGCCVVTALNSTEIVSRAEQIHHTSAVVTAALGRLLTAGSLMGYLLKSEDDSLTLQIKGGGPVGSLAVVAHSNGDVKGYPANPVVELPLNPKGKLDVAGAVGTDGFLYVMRDLGHGEPYIGNVPLVSGEIAEDITQYYATSEQTPTVCGLGVLVNPDLTVQCAGGFLLQLLPFTPDDVIEQVEKNVSKIQSVTQLLSQGKTPADICEMLLEGMDPNVLDEGDCAYRCDCSRERVARALLSLGHEDLQEIIDDGQPVELGCHFCNQKYVFSIDEVKALKKG